MPKQGRPAAWQGVTHTPSCSTKPSAHSSQSRPHILARSGTRSSQDRGSCSFRARRRESHPKTEFGPNIEAVSASQVTNAAPASSASVGTSCGASWPAPCGASWLAPCGASLHSRRRALCAVSRRARVRVPRVKPGFLAQPTHATTMHASPLETHPATRILVPTRRQLAVLHRTTHPATHIRHALPPHHAPRSRPRYIARFLRARSRIEGNTPHGESGRAVHARVPRHRRAPATMPRSSSRTTGTRKSRTRPGASSVTSRSRSTTSTRAARACRRSGIAVLRPPRDGRMAFVKSPDGQSVELLQRGAAPPERAVGVDAEPGRVVSGASVGTAGRVSPGDAHCGIVRPRMNDRLARLATTLHSCSPDASFSHMKRIHAHASFSLALLSCVGPACGDDPDGEPTAPGPAPQGSEQLRIQAPRAARAPAVGP